MTANFPPLLLKQSTSQRLAYFETFTAAHPRLKEARETLLRAIKEPAGASLIFVYGPSGVGKTTLRLKVEQTLLQQALPKLEADRGRVPVVGIEAVAPESRNFSWKDYYTRALVALEEPLIDRKFNYGVRGIYRNLLGQMVIEPKIVAPALRRGLEQALRHRAPDISFIDEAQHMAKMASGHRLQDQLDCLKSLSNMSGILHGLIGTYELLTFRNLSAQLSRRSIDIHFQRYRLDLPEDVKAFQSVILTLQRQMPLEELPDLVTHWEYCYERTLGCVGILKNWFTRALKGALESGAITVTLSDLEKRAWSVAQCQKMFQEIQEGEKQLAETESDRDRLRVALGLKQPETPIQLPEVPSIPPRRQVGKRQPKRDKIGMEQHVSS